jgi:transcriptional regulator with XRE-family HTH domain
VVVKSNKQVGIEIKKRRKALGISQMKLAGEVGVSFQQIQKYEKGVNKISVERIQQIAGALGTSVHSFFEKEKAPLVSESPDKYYLHFEMIEDISLPLSQDDITLLRLFQKIDNGKIREGLISQLLGIIELKGQKK